MVAALRRVRFAVALLVALSPAGCARPSVGLPGGGGASDDSCAAAPACDASITVAPDSPALIITDPVALSKLPLEDVLSRLLEDFNDPPVSPQQLLQAMFDSNNDGASAVFNHNYHCDDEDNPAHENGPAAECPRAEGALALSSGFFTPGHPDHFYPVAVVNRIDLMLSGSSCGEYRIIYAKESGKTDPNNRVFLIFEPALPNPEFWCEHSCRPVAELWKSFEHEESAEALGDRLRQFFLEGTGAFPPAIQLSNFQPGPSGGTGYYGAKGQIRVSQHIGSHWELREFSYWAHWEGARFEPKLLGNNPSPSSFRGFSTDGKLSGFGESFLANVELLGRDRVTGQGMLIGQRYLSGESEQGGDHINDYAAASKDNTYLHSAIDFEIAALGIGADCPADDPLDAQAILRRATMQSCAGCHAPSRFLGPERKIGCGVTWPDSLGDVHVDEHGTLSPALREVFLPHRAEVFTTYLQACDPEAVAANVGGPFGTAAQELRSRRPGATLGGSVTH